MATISIPNDNTRLRRGAFAEALTAAGYPVAATTLATMATRGGGPPYQKFGRYPIYTFGEGLRWAQSRLSPVVTTTSELDAPVGQ
jgi:hypothetical protein